MKQAVNLGSRIDSFGLRQLLRLENGKLFDPKLCEELVVYFGDCSTINFSDFKSIWLHLKKRRLDFDKFSYRNKLCPASFQMLLEKITHKKLNFDFIKKLVDFYGKQITFDAFVHAVHHVQIITESSSRLCSVTLMEKFRGSIQTSTISPNIFTEIQPSAPQEELISNRYCTYI